MEQKLLKVVQTWQANKINAWQDAKNKKGAKLKGGKIKENDILHSHKKTTFLC